MSAITKLVQACQRLLRLVAICAAAAGALSPASAAAQARAAAAIRETLSTALAQEDAAAIGAAVAEANRQWGERAGIPKTPDQYLPIPRGASWLAVSEAMPGFEPWFKQLESLSWWRVGLDPAQLGHPLREPAAVASGLLAAVRAGLNGAERSLALAKGAGDFLIWAQARAGSGVFPFPASRGISNSAPFVSAERQLRRAEREGRREAMVSNGWAIDDEGDGGLQFDNAEAGAAVLALYEATHDSQYLNAAKRSADWALLRPLVVNWNYNSFSVYLLARIYRVTGQAHYLEAATKKAMLGVMPGQLQHGPQAGRWNDAHNARPAYHYILLRSLAELARALPGDHAARPKVLAALRLGLTARNKDYLDRGAPNKDKAIETLLIVNRAFADDPQFLKDTQSADALDALARLVSAQARRGHLPLGPSEWGHFLEYVTWKNRR